MPFMENEAYRVTGDGLMCEAIADLHGIVFGYESSEQFVPHNEQHAHAPVEVLHAARVVSAVVARGDKSRSEPVRFRHDLRMYQHAEELRGAVGKHNVVRFESAKRHRDKISETVNRLQ